jgi:phage protein D
MGLGVAVLVNGKQDKELSDAVSIEVHESMGDVTTYRIRYDVDDPEFPALEDGRLDPGSELAVVAQIDDKNIYLVKGPVTGQQIRYVHGVSGTYLEVLGADTSVAMNRETRAVAWTDLTDSDAVSSILGQYAYKADVDVTDAGHYEKKHTLIQRDTDFRFVRRLARRNGFLFWITCDENGDETAHFRRPSLDGEPATNIDINIESNNIAALELAFDVEEHPTSVVAAEINLNDKSTIDGAVEKSPLEPLGAQGLSSIAAGTRSVHVLMPVDDAGDLRARGEAALIDSGWFVRGRCQTSAHALNAIVRAHSIVKVRGTGARHSGKYFVASVRHLVDRDEHRMDIELVRNGWGN